MLNREENLKYALSWSIWRKYNPEGYPSFLVGDSTQGPIIRAIRYGVDTGYAAEVGAEHRGHKETPRNPCRISGSDIL